MIHFTNEGHHCTLVFYSKRCCVWWIMNESCPLHGRLSNCAASLSTKQQCGRHVALLLLSALTMSALYPTEAIPDPLDLAGPMNVLHFTFDRVSVPPFLFCFSRIQQLYSSSGPVARSSSWNFREPVLLVPASGCSRQFLVFLRTWKVLIYRSYPRRASIFRFRSPHG